MIRVALDRLASTPRGRVVWPVLRGALLRWQATGAAHVELSGVPLDVVTIATTTDPADLAPAVLVVHGIRLEGIIRARLGPPSPDA